MLCLVVQTGPDRGRNIPLEVAPLTIGRGADQGLQLNDGAVSRHHLTVRASPDGATLAIHEITGVNPCWTLREGKRVELRPGEALPVGTAFTLGNTTLRVEEIHQGPNRGNRSGRPSRTVELDATQVVVPRAHVVVPHLHVRVIRVCAYERARRACAHVQARATVRAGGAGETQPPHGAALDSVREEGAGEAEGSGAAHAR